MTYSSPTKEIPLNNNHESANRGDNYTIYDPKSGQYTTKMLDRAPSPLVDSTYEDMYIKMFPEQSRPHHLLPTTAAATTTTAHHAAAADKQHCYENVTADTLGELPSIPPRDSGNAGDELYDLNAGQQYSGSKKKARPSSLPCREPLETCSEGVNNKLSSVNSQGLTNTGKDVTDVSVSGPHARHGKLKGLKKSMTLAFSRSSPKKQSTEATSRFYIEPSRESIKQGKVKSSQFYIDSQGESIKESKPESLNSQRESSYESIEENNAEPGDKIAEIEEYSPDCVTPTENMGKRRIYSKKDSSAADMNINFENLNMKSKTADQLDIKSLDKHGRSNGQTLCEHSPDDYMNVGAHRSGSPEMMIREFGASKSRAIHRKNRDDTKYMLISFDDQSKKPGKKAGSPDMGKRFEEEKNSADETEMPRYVNVAIGRSKNEEYRITGIDQVYENPPSDKKTRESHKRSKSADHTANLSLSKTGMLEFVELKGKGRSATTGDSAKLDPSRYVNLHQLGSPNLESVTEDISESQDKLDETKNLDSEANLSHSPTRQREKCQRAAHTNHKYYTSVDLEKFCKTSEKSGSPTDSPPDSPGSPGSPKLMQRKKNRHLYMDITDVTISRRKPSPDLSPKKSTDINSYVNFRFGGESHTSSQPRPIRKSRSYENLLDGSPGQYSMKTKFERKAPQSYADLEFPTGPKTELGRCRSVGLVLSPVKDNARELYFGSVPSETKIKHHVSKSDRPRSLEYDQSSLTEQGSSPSRSQRITYTEVDFEKSRSVAVAVKELRSDSNLSNSSADQEASSI